MSLHILCSYCVGVLVSVGLLLISDTSTATSCVTHRGLEDHALVSWSLCHVILIPHPYHHLIFIIIIIIIIIMLIIHHYGDGEDVGRICK